METQRFFERVEVELPVEFEFVNFRESHTDELDKPKPTKAVDISISGVGVHEFPGLDNHTANQLLKGEKKVRLGIRLYPDMPPVIFFARMVWNEDEGKTKGTPSSSGCAFIDVTQESFYLLKKFIESYQETQVSI